MIRILKTMILLLFLFALGFTQDSKVRLPLVVPENAGCEITELELWTVYSQLIKDSKSAAFIIIVGEKADSEKDRHNKRRIRQVSDYFRKRGLNADRIYSARSESGGKAGLVKVFVEGTLVLIMKSKPKQSFCTACCYEPEN